MGFWEGFVDGLSGVVNIVGGAIGLPEIPKIGPPGSKVFGHKAEEEAYEQDQANQRHDKAKAEAFNKINSISLPPITLPDIKPTAQNQNFAMPPVYVPKEPVVDAKALKEAQDEIVLQQQIMYGTIGVGGLAMLYLLKK
jgi:hypothetical protein